jgi:hypothetical protein
MRLFNVLCCTGIALLAGCAGGSTSSITFDPNRTYTHQQISLPQAPQTTQPNFQPYGSQASEYS